MIAQQKSWRSAIPVRMALCLAISAIVICTTFVAIGFVEKAFHDGLTEALGRVTRAATHVTVRELVRMTILSSALGSIACFPVYCNPAQARIRPGLMILCAALAALALAGYLSFESWYRFGDRAVPPAGLILALAAAGLASAYVSRTVLRLWLRLS